MPPEVPSARSGGLLLAWPRHRAADLRVHAQVVQGTSDDRYRDRARPGATGDGPVVIAALAAGDSTDDQPYDKQYCPDPHLALRRHQLPEVQADSLTIPARAIADGGRGDSVKPGQAASASASAARTPGGRLNRAGDSGKPLNFLADPHRRRAGLRHRGRVGPPSSPGRVRKARDAGSCAARSPGTARRIRPPPDRSRTGACAVRR